MYDEEGHCIPCFYAVLLYNNNTMPCRVLINLETMELLSASIPDNDSMVLNSDIVFDEDIDLKKPTQPQGCSSHLWRFFYACLTHHPGSHAPLRTSRIQKAGL